MADEGRRMTDADFRRLQAKIKRVYLQAYGDMYRKNADFIKRHEKKEARYRAMVDAGKLSKADFKAWMRGQVFQGQQWENRKKQMRETLFHADQIAMEMVNDSRFNVFANNANYIGYELEQHGRIDSGFGLYDENTVRRLLVEEPDLLPPRKVGKDKSYQWYNRTIQNSITQGIIQGEKLYDIAKRIAQATGETNMNAMLRNARTMHTGAENAGRIEGMHQAQRLGIEVQKKWLATLDGHTRDAHRDLDGQVRDVDKPFDSSLGKIRFPGDATAFPGLVWNCRCTLTYVYPKYPDSMAQRRDNITGEVIEDMTYREWEAMKRGEGEAPEPEKPEPTIAGVERGKPMSHDDADSGNVNPNYGTNPAYGINCQSCVVTYEARRRGYDIEVVPNNAEHPMCDRLARDSRLAYKNKDGTQADYTIGDAKWTWKGAWEGETPTAKRFEKLLNETLDESGRYTVQFKWQGYNAAHIVTLTKDNSGPVIYDPQSNRTFRGKDMSDYLARMQYKRQYKGATYYQWPSVMRVDDKDFDFDVLNQVTHRR